MRKLMKLSFKTLGAGTAFVFLFACVAAQPVAQNSEQKMQQLHSCADSYISDIDAIPIPTKEINIFPTLKANSTFRSCYAEAYSISRSCRRLLFSEIDANSRNYSCLIEYHDRVIKVAGGRRVILDPLIWDIQTKLDDRYCERNERDCRIASKQMALSWKNCIHEGLCSKYGNGGGNALTFAQRIHAAYSRYISCHFSHELIEVSDREIPSIQAFFFENCKS